MPSTSGVPLERRGKSAECLLLLFPVYWVFEWSVQKRHVGGEFAAKLCPKKRFLGRAFLMRVWNVSWRVWFIVIFIALVLQGKVKIPTRFSWIQPYALFCKKEEKAHNFCIVCTQIGNSACAICCRQTIKAYMYFGLMVC